MVVARNFYGPQINSQFNEVVTKEGLNFMVSFIRAPAILEIGKNVEILAEFEGRPVAVRSHNFIGISFHPEMSRVTYFHEIAFANVLNK